MTTQKISAGYFDSNRQSPIYVGDVYKEEGAMIPYHKVIKDPENGFMVEHVGTTEKFSLATDAKNLIKKTYLGNVFDTPDWDELVGNKKTELNRHPQDESTNEKSSDVEEETKTETKEEELPEDVKAFLNGDTEELPEGTEEITTEEAETLQKEATDKNSDNVVSAEATTGPTDAPADNEPKSDNDNQPPDVVASTKEEKRLQEKRNDYQRHIKALERKNDELETEAVRFENLASTLTFEPFVELKMIVSNAVQDYAKKQDIKECEKHLKNYKSIDSMETLLKDYKDLAEKNRSNIELNNKEIEDYKAKVEDINDKLNNFQRKLAFAESEQEVKTESEQPASADNVNETKGDNPEETEGQPTASETPEDKPEDVKAEAV